MAITKDQWQKIEQELSHAFGNVKLKCDSYDVTLQITPVGNLQYGILVYVNGHWKGKWIVEDCEERRRFFRPVEHFLHSAKERLELLKIYGGKRASKEDVERINRKLTSYASHWTSVKSLRRHLEKNNQELVLVSIGGVDVQPAAAVETSTMELAAAAA